MIDHRGGRRAEHTDDYRHTARDRLNAGLDHGRALPIAQEGRLTRGAEQEDAVDARFQVKLKQPLERSGIDVAGLGQRRADRR
jgi:hypothetical protein